MKGFFELGAEPHVWCPAKLRIVRGGKGDVFLDCVSANRLLDKIKAAVYKGSSGGKADVEASVYGKIYFWCSHEQSFSFRTFLVLQSFVGLVLFCFKLLFYYFN